MGTIPTKKKMDTVEWPSLMITITHNSWSKNEFSFYRSDYYLWVVISQLWQWGTGYKLTSTIKLFNLHFSDFQIYVLAFYLLLTICFMELPSRFKMDLVFEFYCFTVDQCWLQLVPILRILVLYSPLCFFIK